MRFFRNLENFFEKHIEGYFNKKFPGELQPVELAKRLVKEMETNVFISISKVYAPNAYTVTVSVQDYKKFVPYKQAICNELSAYLYNEAHRRDYTMLGKPSVMIVNAEKPLKTMQFSAEFSEPIPEEVPQTEIANDPPMEVDSATRIFDKVLDTNKPPQQNITATLTVTEGVDQGKSQTISSSRINIGRRKNNEFALLDMNTSRLHAYIVLDEMLHIVHDAKSLNGTYVNDQRITRKPLSTGDKIKLGNTTILYEVK